MENEHVLEDNTVTLGSDDLLEETMNYESSQFADHNSKSEKRGREEDDDDETWTEVRSRKERMREIRESFEIYVTAKEKFPKQFALAKLFKSQKVMNVSKVKYINPYKITIEFTNESSAEYFINCQHFLDLDWRFQRPFKVGLSYGIIKNIELDLSEKELTECITSTYEVISVKRLKRKVQGVGWTDCESIRIGFKGPNLPPNIAIFDMKVKVEPYLFPVTQCLRCWRFGHTSKLCPSKRIHCPKCGEKHENCDVKSYKCINCKNNHMALDRNCPVFLKEKKIRDIMAEFNVTYRKASTMYVKPTPIQTNTFPASTSTFPALPSKNASCPPQNALYFESTTPVEETIT